jgi:hypothetical protein
LYQLQDSCQEETKDWGINFPNLLFHWVDLCAEGILVPDHNTHSFIYLTESLSSTSSTPLPTFDPVASIVRIVNLHHDCPSTLLQALANFHPDHEVWLQSYYEEKGRIEGLVIFCCISLGEYWALCKEVAPKAFSTVCISTIKKDEQLMLLQA